MSIRETVKDRLATVAPDCGDNSCRFAVKRGGMRTNGGCRCVENAGGSRSMIKWDPFQKLAAAQAGIINELLNEIDRLNKEKYGE